MSEFSLHTAKPGDALPNGATLVAVGSDRLGYVVLAVAHAGTKHAEYATWVGDDAGHTFNGHYFPVTEFAAATADFQERQA